MNFYKINVHNKGYAYIGTIIGSVDTYLSGTNKIGSTMGIIISAVALLFILMAFRQPKEIKKDHL